MDVPTNPLTITKVEGAVRQIEAAIRALVSGDFDVAITLAGAAEGMVEQSKTHIFSSMLQRLERLQLFDKKTWVDVLNRDRDWLKHPTTDMIARATSKIEPEQWTPPMQEFKFWYMANLTELETASQQRRGLIS